MNLSLTSSKIQSCIQQLCDALFSLQIVTDSKKIHIFGSRVYGLATNTTDIDIYLETGKTIQLTIIIVRLQSIFSIFFFLLFCIFFIKYKHKVKININIRESFNFIEV